MPYGVATQSGGSAVTAKQKHQAAEAFRRDLAKRQGEKRGEGRPEKKK